MSPVPLMFPRRFIEGNGGLVAGRFLQANDTRVVVVDRHYAAFFSLKPGSVVTIGGESFQVVGIVEAQEGSRAGVANFYFPLAEAQRLAHLNTETINQIYVRVAHASAVDEVVQQSRAALGEVNATTEQSIVQVMGSIALVSQRVAGITSLVALLGGLVLAGMARSASVAERRREIGVMKALGWTASDVRRYFLAKGLVLSLVGALAFFSAAQFTLLVSLTIAILRYHLFDIDRLINRTLVYGALSVILVAVYGILVGSFSVLFQTSGNFWVSLVATALIAIWFQHAREHVQAVVNRLLYGDRDEPYAALARLGRRLETTLVPEAVLPTIVETVAQSLKLPYAAIELATDEPGGKPAAAFPSSAAEPPADTVRLALIYQNEKIGQFLLAPRSLGEPFTAADYQLLQDFARQAGIAAHAVQLTRDLQR